MARITKKELEIDLEHQHATIMDLQNQRRSYSRTIEQMQLELNVLSERLSKMAFDLNTRNIQINSLTIERDDFKKAYESAKMERGRLIAYNEQERQQWQENMRLAQAAMDELKAKLRREQRIIDYILGPEGELKPLKEQAE